MNKMKIASCAAKIKILFFIFYTFLVHDATLQFLIKTAQFSKEVAIIISCISMMTSVLINKTEFKS